MLKYVLVIILFLDAGIQESVFLLFEVGDRAVRPFNNMVLTYKGICI